MPQAGGKDIAVTAANREEYTRLVAEFLVYGQACTLHSCMAPARSRRSGGSGEGNDAIGRGRLVDVFHVMPWPSRDRRDVVGWPR